MFLTSTKNRTKELREYVEGHVACVLVLSCRTGRKGIVCLGEKRMEKNIKISGITEKKKNILVELACGNFQRIICSVKKCKYSRHCIKMYFFVKDRKSNKGEREL